MLAIALRVLHNHDLGIRIPNRALYGAVFAILLLLGTIAALRLQQLETRLNETSAGLIDSGRIAFLSGLIGRAGAASERLTKSYDPQQATDFSVDLLKLQDVVAEVEQKFADQPSQVARFGVIRDWINGQFGLVRGGKSTGDPELALAQLRGTMAAISNADVAQMRMSLDQERELASSSRQLFWGLSMISLAVILLTVWRATRDSRLRSAAELALQLRDEQYRQVVETASDIIYRTDKSGRLTFCNQAALNLLHWTREEVIGCSYLTLIRHDKRKEAARFYLRQFARKRENSYYEFPVVDGHGRERWLGQNAQPIAGADGFEGFQAIARDITERKRVELELNRSRTFLERIAATTPGILRYVYDIVGKLTLYSNREVTTLLGYKQDELLTYVANSTTNFHPEDLGAIRSHHEALRHLADGEVRRLEYRARHRDGHWVWLAVQDTPFERGNDGLVKHIVGIGQDVTARRVAQEQLAWQANYDALTGLANRHHFWTRLQTVLGRAAIEHSAAALCLLDIDNFKEINDKYGHAAGDEVLAAVGTILRRELRSSDLSGRLGGDEFVFVMPETDAHDAERLAERILDRLRTQAFGAGGDLEPFLVTATFGVAEWQPHVDAAELMDAADRALYRAKAAGRNRVGIDV